MGRDHFAQMHRRSSHRHDSIRDYEQFQKDFGSICGMLYSVVTLKAFFPKSPAAAIIDNPSNDAAPVDNAEQI